MDWAHQCKATVHVGARPSLNCLGSWGGMAYSILKKLDELHHLVLKVWGTRVPIANSSCHGRYRHKQRHNPELSSAVVNPLTVNDPKNFALPASSTLRWIVKYLWTIESNSTWETTQVCIASGQQGLHHHVLCYFSTLDNKVQSTIVNEKWNTRKSTLRMNCDVRKPVYIYSRISVLLTHWSRQFEP